jgi:hypothetical protein
LERRQTLAQFSDVLLDTVLHRLGPVPHLAEMPVHPAHETSRK